MGRADAEEGFGLPVGKGDIAAGLNEDHGVLHRVQHRKGERIIAGGIAHGGFRHAAVLSLVRPTSPSTGQISAIILSITSCGSPDRMMAFRSSAGASAASSSRYQPSRSEEHTSELPS